MQVVIFDKKCKCLYRVIDVPINGTFKDVYKAMKFPENSDNYNAFILETGSDLCIDEYKWDGTEMKLFASNCN